jgi:hypothetical protein
MMSIIADKALKKTPTMYRLGRSWRKENEGTSQEWNRTSRTKGRKRGNYFMFLGKRKKKKRRKDEKEEKKGRN